MAWSPDSRRIAFKGKRIESEEIAVVTLSERPAITRCLVAKYEFANDLEWSADGQEIFFNMHSRDHQRSLLFRIDVVRNAEPRLVREAGVAKAWKSVSLDSGGKWMVLAGPD